MANLLAENEPCVLANLRDPIPELEEARLVTSYYRALAQRTNEILE